MQLTQRESEALETRCLAAASGFPLLAERLNGAHFGRVAQHLPPAHRVGVSGAHR